MRENLKVIKEEKEIDRRRKKEEYDKVYEDLTARWHNQQILLSRRGYIPSVKEKNFYNYLGYIKDESEASGHDVEYLLHKSKSSVGIKKRIKERKMKKTKSSSNFSDIRPASIRNTPQSKPSTSKLSTSSSKATASTSSFKESLTIEMDVHSRPSSQTERPGSKSSRLLSARSNASVSPTVVVDLEPVVEEPKVFNSKCSLDGVVSNAASFAAVLASSVVLMTDTLAVSAVNAPVIKTTVEQAEEQERAVSVGPSTCESVVIPIPDDQTNEISENQIDEMLKDYEEKEDDTRISIADDNNIPSDENNEGDTTCEVDTNEEIEHHQEQSEESSEKEQTKSVLSSHEDIVPETTPGGGIIKKKKTRKVRKVKHRTTEQNSQAIKSVVQKSSVAARLRNMTGTTFMGSSSGSLVASTETDNDIQLPGSPLPPTKVERSNTQCSVSTTTRQNNSAMEPMVSVSSLKQETPDSAYSSASEKTS